MHVVSAAGGGERALTSESDEVVTPLAWSPDGTRILFTPGQQRGVFAMNADGTCTSSSSGFDPGQGLVWQPVPGKEADRTFRCAEVGIFGDFDAGDTWLHGRRPYSVTLTNDGNLDATDFRVVRQRSDHLARDSLDGDHARILRCVVCNLGTMLPRETANVTVTLGAPTPTCRRPCHGYLAFTSPPPGQIRTPDRDVDRSVRRRMDAGGSAPSCRPLHRDLLRRIRSVGSPAQTASSAGMGTTCSPAARAPTSSRRPGAGSALRRWRGRRPCAGRRAGRIDCGSGRDTVIADRKDSLRLRARASRTPLVR